MTFQCRPANSIVCFALITMVAAGVPVRSAHAQRASQLQLGMRRVETHVVQHSLSRGDTTTLQSRLHLDSIPPSRWKTGMIIGGVVGGGVAFLLVDAANHIGDTPTSITPLGLLGPVAVFALIGGLIGSGFH